ncbi:MAG: helix-turn-helix domain-containing protein [Lachnospiraceae bacterium]|nr:helix-turn-helix domain-containing protein [Lachnospiraceae bacterium]
MEFSNRLYQLRKQKGMSQEELASRLNVSRQTVSKWEVGDSTPDMEKLVAISDLFEVSLDQLVMGKEPVTEKSGEKPTLDKSEFLNVMNEKVLTEENKKKTKRGLKVAGIILLLMVLIDMISMIVYFILYGVPQ